ncbi:MAG: ABC transporter permease [Lachnospiraceae bacterium]|jgi:peptide/nickel transport system permease protein|nr:ABC transporter permease [Lachnospiraceae bacterium]
MVTTKTMTAETHIRYKKESQFMQVLKRLAQDRFAMTGLGILIVIILLSTFAPVITPYSANAFDPKVALQGSSMAHWLGCDKFGRDMLTRLLYGGRYSLLLGFTAAAASAVIGLVLGAFAGYFGGWVDNLVMRFLDVLQAIPGMLLSICIATALGNGFLNTIIALSIGGIAGITRMLRARIMSERKSEYLEAAASINCSTSRIIFKHLLPNTVSPVIVNITMGIGATIMQAAGLSYIGLGVPVGTPEWGAMLSEGRAYIQSAPHLLLWPGVFIAVTVLAINMLGDGLRDAMDPRLKK